MLKTFTPRRLAAAATAVLGSSCAFSSFTSAATSNTTVKLTSSVNRNVLPTVVLIHGLDSAKDTWTAAQAELQQAGVPTLALDLRGHGESPLGPVEEFSCRALAADIEQSIKDHGVTDKFVLVGHSMGGRVVMRYAAEYPEQLAALIVEDMDLRVRHYSVPDSELATRLASFNRHFETWDDLSTSLVSFGYDEQRVGDWKKYGRVYPTADGGWCSGINPTAQHLAIRHILASNEGHQAWRTIADADAGFPVSLQIADKGSATKVRAVEEMLKVMPRAEVRHFPGSWHSIHNTSQNGAWAKHVIEIVEQVKASR